MTTIIEKKCPICNSTANYIFTSKNNKKIFQCCFLSCGHFFTPMLKTDQGICVRPDDLEKESNESLKIFDKRNLKLLKLFIKIILSKIAPNKSINHLVGFTKLKD